MITNVEPAAPIASSLLIVTNTDGGVSEPFPVTVRKARPTPDEPIISRVTPDELPAGPEPQTVPVR